MSALLLRCGASFAADENPKRRSTAAVQGASV